MYKSGSLFLVSFRFCLWSIRHNRCMWKDHRRRIGRRCRKRRLSVWTEMRTDEKKGDGMRNAWRKEAMEWGKNGANMERNWKTNSPGLKVPNKVSRCVTWERLDDSKWKGPPLVKSERLLWIKNRAGCFLFFLYNVQLTERKCSFSKECLINAIFKSWRFLPNWQILFCTKTLQLCSIHFCFEKERKLDEEENERGRDRERRLRAANQKSLFWDFVGLEPSGT